ncbi:hypothetical protein B484DRAFT_399643 [Ochromonadaceae sp. CCMP2298]|nr:hypothetical protein B484DRAFT_399643 [Ochromonadaceae sp. CCMP2298]
MPPKEATLKKAKPPTPATDVAAMLNSGTFRRTQMCSHYKTFLQTKDTPQYPIQRIPDGLSVPRSPLSQPFVVTDLKNLGMALPDAKDLTYVAQVVGLSHPVKVMEVGTQNELSTHTLGQFAHYLKHYSAEHKVLNMITLEFSNTPLNNKVQSPSFVREMDWIDCVWPMSRRSRGDYPKVQKYCLAGMGSSYTDFHIDFGGTSVWYHVLHGRKVFYLVPPTIPNLRAFVTWTKSKTQADTFFPDTVPGQCFQFTLNPGQTFIIPSGWIHAVYTPIDSLVFGGNFVHIWGVLRQLQVYQMEGETRVTKAYRLPFFRQLNWYLLCALLDLAERRHVPGVGGAGGVGADGGGGGGAGATYRGVCGIRGGVDPSEEEEDLLAMADALVSAVHRLMSSSV